jgi:hypothetical protein
MRRYRIGRSETNDIVIPDASVSRQHAEAVELGGGRFALSDLGSTFGTHVWQGQGWTAAKETEIRADTVIRFGEFRTTLMDVLSEIERAALGLTSPPPQPAPTPTPPEPVKPPEPTQAQEPPAPPRAAPPAAAPAPPPRTVAPEPPPAASPAPPPPPPAESRAQTVERPPATREAPRAAPAARRRGPAPGGKRRALVLGLLAVGGFFAVAAGVIAIVLAFGDPSGTGPRREPRTAAGEGPQKVLEACKTNWGIEERRCRCFLAAAGPHLQPEDYDDFATLVEGHLSGDSTLMESVMQQAGEKRGAPASARLSAAMKGVVRDCPE